MVWRLCILMWGSKGLSLNLALCSERSFVHCDVSPTSLSASVEKSDCGFSFSMNSLIMRSFTFHEPSSNSVGQKISNSLLLWFQILCEPQASKQFVCKSDQHGNRYLTRKWLTTRGFDNIPKWNSWNTWWYSLLHW